MYCLVHRLGTGRKLVGKQILLLIARIQHISNHAADCKSFMLFMMDVLVDENVHCTCVHKRLVFNVDQGYTMDRQWHTTSKRKKEECVSKNHTVEE